MTAKLGRKAVAIFLAFQMTLASPFSFSSRSAFAVERVIALTDQKQPEVSAEKKNDSQNPQVALKGPQSLADVSPLSKATANAPRKAPIISGHAPDNQSDALEGSYEVVAMNGKIVEGTDFRGRKSISMKFQSPSALKLGRLEITAKKGQALTHQNKNGVLSLWMQLAGDKVNYPETIRMVFIDKKGHAALFYAKLSSGVQQVEFDFKKYYPNFNDQAISRISIIPYQSHKNFGKSEEIRLWPETGPEPAVSDLEKIQNEATVVYKRAVADLQEDNQETTKSIQTAAKEQSAAVEQGKPIKSLYNDGKNLVDAIKKEAGDNPDFKKQVARAGELGKLLSEPYSQQLATEKFYEVTLGLLKEHRSDNDADLKAVQDLYNKILASKDATEAATLLTQLQEKAEELPRAIILPLAPDALDYVKAKKDMTAWVAELKAILAQIKKANEEPAPTISFSNNLVASPAITSPDGQYKISQESGYLVLRDKTGAELGRMVDQAQQASTNGISATNKGVYSYGQQRSNAFISFVPFDNFKSSASESVVGRLPAEVKFHNGSDVAFAGSGIADIRGSDFVTRRVDLEKGTLINPDPKSDPTPDPTAAAIDKAKTNAASLFGIPKSGIGVDVVVETQWPDGCLGLPEKNEVCSQAKVSGYNIQLTYKTGGKAALIYRSDKEGKNVRFDILASALPLINAAKDQMLQEIRKRTNLTATDKEILDHIEVASVEAKRWSDSCLGVTKPGVVCMQVVTPGYKIGMRYPMGIDAAIADFHTDLFTRVVPAFFGIAIHAPLPGPKPDPNLPAPVIAAVADVVVTDAVVTRTISLKNFDPKNPVALSVSAPPPFATFKDNGNGTATLTAVPTHDHNLAHDVFDMIVTAMDSHGASFKASFKIICNCPDVMDQMHGVEGRIVNVHGQVLTLPQTTYLISTDTKWSAIASNIKNGAVVEIASGAHVLYDVTSDVHLNTLLVHGELKFATDANTKLVVGNFVVADDGALIIGTEDNPVASNVKAEVVIADQAIDLVKDPTQLGTGLIVLGKIDIHGSPMKETFVDLSKEPKAGDKTLTLSSVPEGWKAGDRLTLADTRQLPVIARKSWPSQTEEVIIAGISGNVVALASALKYDHLGQSDGTVSFKPQVTDISRNVTIRSENPSGTRGHTLFTGRADVHIKYAAFSDLGRTQNGRLDNADFDANGKMIRAGGNQQGRYAVHFHHLMGPVNPTNTGYQYEFEGNSVSYSKRWAVVVHNTSYGLVKDNDVYAFDGAGIVTEAGTEVGNLFEHNFIIGFKEGDLRSPDIFTDSNRGDFKAIQPTSPTQAKFQFGGVGNPAQKTAMWLRGDSNPVIRNVMAAAQIGLEINGYYNSDPIRFPAFRGADNSNPAQTITFQDKKETAATHKDAPPSGEHTDNTIFAVTNGVWLTWKDGCCSVATSKETSLFSGFKLYNISSRGVEAYHTAGIAFKDFVMINDLNVANQYTGGTHQGRIIRYSSGFFFDNKSYENGDMTIENARIVNYHVGIDAPPRPKGANPNAPGVTKILGGFLNNYVNIRIPLSTLDKGMENLVIIDGTKFAHPAGMKALPGFPPQPLNIWMDFDDNNRGNKVVTGRPQTVKVFNYNGNAGQNFQVYFKEQAADFVLPVGTTDTAGHDLSGLTNQAAMALYGLNAVFAGMMNPSHLTTMPEIEGLIDSNLIPDPAPAPAPAPDPKPDQILKDIQAQASALLQKILAAVGEDTKKYQQMLDQAVQDASAADKQGAPLVTSSNDGAKLRDSIQQAVQGNPALANELARAEELAKLLSASLAGHQAWVKYYQDVSNSLKDHLAADASGMGAVRKIQSDIAASTDATKAADLLTLLTSEGGKLPKAVTLPAVPPAVNYKEVTDKITSWLTELRAILDRVLKPAPAPAPGPQPNPQKDVPPDPTPLAQPIPAQPDWDITKFPPERSKRVLYVSNQGDDNNEGTRNAPLLTLDKAVEIAQKGDEIVLTAGTYRLNTVINITNDSIYIHGEDPNRRSLIICAAQCLDIQASHFELSDVILDGQFARRADKGGYRAIVLRSGDYGHLHDLEIRNFTTHEVDIRVGSEYNVIERFNFHHALNFRGDLVGKPDKKGKIQDGRVDAHLIVSDASHLIIRDGVGHTFSGDFFQQGSSREKEGWTDIWMQRVEGYLEPLKEDTAGFKAGTVPGENFLDTKTKPGGGQTGRGQIYLQDIVAHGFRNGMISNMAAFNIKETVFVSMDRVKVYNSEVAFRLRGKDPEGRSHWVISNSEVYDVDYAFRLEDYAEPEHAHEGRIWNVTVGKDIKKAVFQVVGFKKPELDVRNMLILEGSPLQNSASQSNVLPWFANTPSNKMVQKDTFVDVDHNDYHLAKNSPAIDAGVLITGVPPQDLDGKARDAKPDVGAFEF